MEKQVISVKEVADMIGVCKETLYTMVRKGEIPHFKMRSRVFFRRESIDIWMKQQEALNYKLN
jgi:excisionase family DNA binding protein